jgi:hypothetical protein
MSSKRKRRQVAATVKAVALFGAMLPLSLLVIRVSAAAQSPTGTRTRSLPFRTTPNPSNDALKAAYFSLSKRSTSRHRVLQGTKATATTVAPTPSLTPTVLQTWGPTVSPFPTATPAPTHAEPCYVCNGNASRHVDVNTESQSTSVSWRGIVTSCAELASRPFVTEFYEQCAELTSLVTQHCPCRDKVDSAVSAPSTPSSSPLLHNESTKTLYPTCRLCPTTTHTLLNPNTTLPPLQLNVTMSSSSSSSDVSAVTCRDVYEWGVQGQLPPRQCQSLQKNTFATAYTTSAKILNTTTTDESSLPTCWCDDTVTLTSTSPGPLKNSTLVPSTTNTTTTTTNRNNVTNNRAPTIATPSSAHPTTVTTYMPTVTPSPTLTNSPTYADACTFSCRTNDDDRGSSSSSKEASSRRTMDNTQQAFNFWGLQVSCAQVISDAARNLVAPDLCRALQPYVQQHCPCAPTVLAAAVVAPTAMPTASLSSTRMPTTTSPPKTTSPLDQHNPTPTPTARTELAFPSVADPSTTTASRSGSPQSSALVRGTRNAAVLVTLGTVVCCCL